MIFPSTENFFFRWFLPDEMSKFSSNPDCWLSWDLKFSFLWPNQSHGRSYPIKLTISYIIWPLLTYLTCPSWEIHPLVIAGEAGKERRGGSAGAGAPVRLREGGPWEAQARAQSLHWEGDQVCPWELMSKGTDQPPPSFCVLLLSHGFPRRSVCSSGIRSLIPWINQSRTPPLPLPLNDVLIVHHDHNAALFLERERDQHLPKVSVTFSLGLLAE